MIDKEMSIKTEKGAYLSRIRSFLKCLINDRLLDLLVNHTMIELSERFYELVPEEDEESISDVNWQGYDALTRYPSNEVKV